MSRPLSVTASVALLLLAVVLLEAEFHPMGKLLSAGPVGNRELAAQVLGQYLAAHYPGRRAIVLSNPFSNQPGQPAEVYQYEKAGIRGLRRGLGEAVQIQQVVFPDLKPGVLQNPRSVFIDPGTTTPLSYLLAEGALDKVASQFPDAELVVSLIGLPVNIERDGIWRTDSKLSFALLLPDMRLLGGVAGVRQAYKAGKIRALVLNKPGAPAEDHSAGHNAKGEFDRRFLLITPETVEEYLRVYPRLFGGNSQVNQPDPEKR